MGFACLLLTIMSHCSTLSFGGGKKQSQIYLQCNRNEKEAIKFYKKIGFNVSTSKLHSVTKKETLTEERCEMNDVEGKIENKQSAHWQFGFLSLPGALREEIEEFDEGLWLSSSSLATFDLLTLHGVPYTVIQESDSIWASFPHGIPPQSKKIQSLFLILIVMGTLSTKILSPHHHQNLLLVKMMTVMKMKMMKTTR